MALKLIVGEDKVSVIVEVDEKIEGDFPMNSIELAADKFVESVSVKNDPVVIKTLAFELVNVTAPLIEKSPPGKV